MTLEAVALHQLDNLDAKLHSFAPVDARRSERRQPLDQLSSRPGPQAVQRLGRAPERWTPAGRRPVAIVGDHWRSGMPAALCDTTKVSSRNVPITTQESGRRRAGSRSTGPELSSRSSRACIAKQLQLDEDETRELKRVIKRLVKRGQLHYGANHLVLAARGRRRGKEQLSRHRHLSPGRGGLRLRAGRPAAPGADRRARHLYRGQGRRRRLERRHGAGAAEDRARPSTRPQSRRGNRRGHRARHAAVRRHLFRIGRHGLSCKSTASRSPQPISVGDPGAKIGPARRQSRDRDGPLSLATTRTAKG